MIDDLDREWFEEHPEATFRVRSAVLAEEAELWTSAQLHAVDLLGDGPPRVVVERVGPHARRVRPLGLDVAAPLEEENQKVCGCTETEVCLQHCAVMELL